MTFVLKPLPYDKSALSPTISPTTMELHYEKHHRGYVEKLNKLTADTAMSRMPLERIVETAWGDPNATSIFDNAAQIWNHDFFWQSMSPTGGIRSIGPLSSRIDAAFGSYEAFERKFVENAGAQFGSGWIWLVVEAGRLKIMTTGDALTPTVLGLRPLLTCDLWEHAYYLDYQNDREKFVRAFLARLVNWGFAAEQLGLAMGESRSPESVRA
ncbi:MAG: superoxide dismutase [Alphaproteobacteria bacterium]|nr:superoxide dismutase [Alphaproteobacteria bacterium]